MIKKIFSFILALAAVITLVSCDGEKIFGHAELRLPLSEDFREFEAETFDAAYSDGNILVAVYRVSFAAGMEDGIPETLTPEQFARLYKKSSGRDAEIKKKGLTPYYEYSETQNGVKSCYLASFYRSKYAYFAVLFAAPEGIYSEKLPEIFSYIENVIFVY